MKRSKRIFTTEFLEHGLYKVLMLGSFLSFLPTLVVSQSNDRLYGQRPSAMELYRNPYPYRGIGFLNLDSSISKNNPDQSVGDRVFRIEPSDAIDGIKYSQPDLAHSLFNFKNGAKVPLENSNQHIPGFILHRNSRFDDRRILNNEHSNKNVIKNLRDIRYLDTNEKILMDVDNPESKTRNNIKDVIVTDTSGKNITDIFGQNKNNFTDTNENLVSVSSDTVLSYVPTDFSYDSNNTSVRLHSKVTNDVPSLNYSSLNESHNFPPASDYVTDDTLLPNTHVYIDSVNQTNFSDITIISTDIFPSTDLEENVTNSLPSIDSGKKLSSGTVAGIVIVVLISVTLLSSAVIYLLYRKFNGRCTSVVEGKFTTDNCGYLDDSLRSSIYLNNHIELPKESSEEMTSLDNDSFLNSLETMTIQNYWADNSKNTKV